MTPAGPSSRQACTWLLEHPAAFLASPFPQLYRLLRLPPSRACARAIYCVSSIYISSSSFWFFSVSFRLAFGYAPVLFRFFFGIIPVYFRLRFVFTSVFFGLFPVYSRLRPGFISVFFGTIPVLFRLCPGLLSVYSRFFSVSFRYFSFFPVFFGKYQKTIASWP